jgi:sugar lactone lactonase YvrE
VIGPTGLGIGSRKRPQALFVADTLNNRIARIPNAMERMRPVGDGGKTVSTGGGLNGPLGLSIAPNGDIITVNGADGNAVETTPAGRQVATTTLDPAGAGVLFGVDATSSGLFFVDDGDNTLRLLH